MMGCAGGGIYPFHFDDLFSSFVICARINNNSLFKSREMCRNRLQKHCMVISRKEGESAVFMKII